MIVTLRLTQTKIKHALGKRGGYPRRFAQVLEFSGREHACERRSPGRQIAARQIVAPGRKLSTGYPQHNAISYILINQAVVRR